MRGKGYLFVIGIPILILALFVGSRVDVDKVDNLADTTITQGRDGLTPCADLAMNDPRRAFPDSLCASSESLITEDDGFFGDFWWLIIPALGLAGWYIYTLATAKAPTKTVEEARLSTKPCKTCKRQIAFTETVCPFCHNTQ